MSSRQTLSEYEEGASATTWDELHAACRKFTFARGFDHYRVSIISTDASCSLLDPPYAVHNYPTGFGRAIKGSQGSDPVAEAFSGLKLAPCVWDQAFYAAAGALERWQRMAEQGCAQGVSVATVDRDRPQLCFSVSSGLHSLRPLAELVELAGEVLLFAFWIAPAVHTLMDLASEEPLLEAIEQDMHVLSSG